MSLEFIKRYVPDLSKEAEDHAYKTSADYIEDYAGTITNQDHIRKLLDHKDQFVNIAAARNPNANSDIIDYALNNGRYSIKTAAMKNPSATPRHIDMALEKHMPIATRVAAAEHPNATEENLLKALDDNEVDVKQEAIYNKNATEKVIDKALDSGAVIVKLNAVMHKNATKANLEKALRDPNDRISKMVQHHPMYKEFFPNGHEQ